MTFNWYSLFNATEFLATGLVSRVLSVTLDGVGDAEILITCPDNQVQVTYDGVFMPVGFAGKNPYVRAPYAVAQDEDGNVWLGIEVPEE